MSVPWQNGYLEEIPVKEGQAVKKGDLMFKIVPTLYQAKLDAELAEVQLAELEFNNTKKLFEKKVVSQNEVALYRGQTGQGPGQGEAGEGRIELYHRQSTFRRHHRPPARAAGQPGQGGGLLTTLSDNSVMWVYFNVPEARYLEYMAGPGQDKEEPKIELVLANGSKFKQSRQDRCDRGPIQQRDREHPLPRGFSEPGPPAASRSDRHRVDPPDVEERHRHPSAGDFRDSRQAVRLRRRQG